MTFNAKTFSKNYKNCRRFNTGGISIVSCK